MTLLQNDTVTCDCGALVQLELYDSVNVDASPELKRKIKNKTINAYHCKSCGLTIPIIKQFLYVDIKNNHWIWCYPDNMKSEKEEIQRSLSSNEDYNRIVSALNKITNEKPRIVFGYNELFELIY